MRLGSRALALGMIAVAFATLSVLRARAADDALVRLEVVVTAADSGEPIDNASIYLKFKEERILRRDKKREWSVKTNREGKALFPAVPEGRVLVQVVAKGWKTYGRYHTLEGPKHILEIELKAPKKWY